MSSNSQQSFGLPLAIGFVSLLLATFVFLTLSQREVDLDQQLDVAKTRVVLSHVSGKIDTRTKALQRMAARWELAAGTREEIWRADASALMKDMPEVETLAWSDPRFVVRWVVDRQDRDVIVGRNNRNVTERHTQLMIARSTGRGQSSGPRELLIGGIGFIYDLPLSFPDGTSAGYLHAAMRYPALFSDLDPAILERFDVQLAINETVVHSTFGDGRVPDADLTEVIEARILGENWMISLAHNDPYAHLRILFVPGAMAALILSIGLLAAAAIIFRAKAFHRARLHIATHRRLQVAINALESPFAYFDEDDRLQNWNRAFAEMNASVADSFTRGMSYETVLRQVVQAGLIPEARAQEDFFVKQRMALHALPSFTLEREHMGGQWIKTVEKRTSDGGTATLWIDITEEKNRQADLERLNTELTDKHEALEMARQRLKIEEERFRAFAEASADWFWQTDADHRLTWFSDNFTGIGSRSRDWYIGKSRVELAHREDLDPDWAEHLRQVEAREPYRDVLLKHEHEDRNVWIRSAGVPQYDDQGKFKGYLGTGTDVTELVEAEQRYDLLREQLSMAISSISEGLVIFSPDDRLILCNDNYRNTNPWSADQIVEGINFHDMLRMSADRGLPEDWTEEEREAWFVERTTMRDRPGSVMEFETADGRWCRVADTRTADGGTVTIRSDITDLKHRQLELEVERNNAEAANRAKTDFLTNMSHELRTPLNAIIGFSDVMVSGIFGELPDRYRSYATDISTSGNHLLSLVNDLLDSAKVESGSFALQISEMQTDDLVSQVLALMQPITDGRGIEIVVDSNVAGSTLRADERALRQIMLNLLSNAAKFSLDDGRITVNLVGAGADLRIEVVDNGIGIAKADLDRVFDRFVQVQDPLRRSHAGTGIGLPLSLSLAEMHGGDLRLESKVGVGTTAILDLPGVIISGATSAMKEAV